MVDGQAKRDLGARDTALEVRAPHRIEENDKRLVAVTLLSWAAGVTFGVLMVSGPWSAALGYGFLGAAIGGPATFVISVTGLVD